MSSGAAGCGVKPTTPTPVPQTRIKEKVLQLHAGYEYISVRVANGSLWSWGCPYGLGNGGTSGKPEDAVVAPVKVVEPTL